MSAHPLYEFWMHRALKLQREQYTHIWMTTDEFEELANTRPRPNWWPTNVEPTRLCGMPILLVDQFDSAAYQTEWVRQRTTYPYILALTS